MKIIRTIFKVGLFVLTGFQTSFAQDTLVPVEVNDSVSLSFFDQYFRDKTLRVDYLLAGNDTETVAYLWHLKEEPFWGGPKKNLVDPWSSGNFRYSLVDTATGELLYRKGFSSLFEEFQGTKEAREVRRAYPMTATMPFPRTPAYFEIDKRNYGSGEFETLFHLLVDPFDYMIGREEITKIPHTAVILHGSPDTCIDIAFIAEGYTIEEMEKFRQDAMRMAEYFLSVEPYASLQDKFNFYAVEAPSEESGVDIPGKGEYRNTGINSSFYTFGSERYLTTPDTWTMRNIAANVPYDQVIILNNSKKYGGGGFYNHYCQSTVDHALSEIVALHEFGHAFGGLADEYVGGVNYDGFYNPDVEPWEPNITTNVDFSSKWSSMIHDTVPLPTPRKPAYMGIVGMFEGGGYMATGIFSPAMNCRMKDNSAEGFCPVCQEAIRRKILFYCD